MKTQWILGALLVTAAAGCARNTRTVMVTPQGDSIISRSDRPLAQVAGTLKRGTRITAVLQEDVSSRNKKPGDVVKATLTRDVEDVNGQVLFPAGTEAEVRIVELRAPVDDRDKGAVGFDVTGMTKGGRTYRVGSGADPSSYQVRDRGPFDDKAPIAVGAGAGAVLGGLITGSVKGAVVGGILGAAGGVVYNQQEGKDKRDVIVKSGTELDFELQQPVVVYFS